MSIAAELIDKRIIRRYLERGVIDSSGFQQYIDQLPDCASRCVQASSDRSTQDVGEDAPQTHAVAP